MQNKDLFIKIRNYELNQIMEQLKENNKDGYIEMILSLYNNCDAIGSDEHECNDIIQYFDLTPSQLQDILAKLATFASIGGMFDIEMLYTYNGER